MSVFMGGETVVKGNENEAEGVFLTSKGMGGESGMVEKSVECKKRGPIWRKTRGMLWKRIGVKIKVGQRNKKRWRDYEKQRKTGVNSHVESGGEADGVTFMEWWRSSRHEG